MVCVMLGCVPYLFESQGFARLSFSPWWVVLQHPAVREGLWGGTLFETEGRIEAGSGIRGGGYGYLPPGH